MSSRFTRALLRRPGRSYAQGITTSDEGAPDLGLALAQHAAYAAALASLGLEVTVLEADERFPDGTFVEDAAVIAGDLAVITAPGAASRREETAAIAQALSAWFANPARIGGTGTLDGGDICETDDLVLIGVTARTNEAGARQLAGLLGEAGRKAELVDIRAVEGLLHLKTGVTWLGEGRIAIAEGLPALPAFARFEQVIVPAAEAYAANCVRVNDKVLIAAGYPRFADTLDALGYRLLPLEMSEFRKMDGGLSCLSLRF